VSGVDGKNVRDRPRTHQDALSPLGRLGADLGVLLAVLATLALVQALLGRGTIPVLMAFGAAEAVAAFVAAGSLCVTGLRHVRGGWPRRSYLLLAAACGSWGFGQVLYAFQDVFDRFVDVTTWADGPFLAFSVLSVVAAVVHVRGRVRAHAGVSAVLDGTLLGLSLLTVIWVLWIGHAMQVSPYSAADLVLPLTYPVLDVVFVTLTIVSLLRGGVTAPGVLLLVAGTAMSAADGIYFYGVLAQGGFETGGFSDHAWIVGFGLFAISARYRRSTRDQLRRPDAGSWGWLVPYLALVPASVFGAVRLWSEQDRFVLLSMSSLVLLTMVRQFLSLADHRKLLAVAEDQRRQLDLMAHVDPLTGLENRRRFSDRIAEAVQRSLRTGVPVVVAFVDLDQFNAVNDTLGHAAGDDLLRGVADRLRLCVREADCAARWGGDEFAVLVTDPGAQAESVAERLREALLEPFLLGGVPHTATASIGAVREDPHRLLAALPDPATIDPVPELVEGLLAAADAKMYVLKRARRGAVEVDR
jgi:diguanylate cyclase